MSQTKTVNKATQTRKGKKFPHFESDDEAARFVAEADLSKYDFSDFRPLSEVLANTEMQRKSKSITFRLSETLLDMLKAEAKAQDIPYQRLMRQILAKGLMPQRPIPFPDIVGAGFDGVVDVSQCGFASRGEGAVARFFARRQRRIADI